MARGKGVEITISPDNFKLNRYLKQALPGMIKAATRMAMTDVAKTIRKEAGKEIGPALGIKSSLIKNRITFFYGKKYGGAVGVYFHYAPMAAYTTAGKRVGGRFVEGNVANPKRGGVKAGGRKFPKGFVGRTKKGPRTGQLSIFKKDGRAKYGVRRIMVELSPQKKMLMVIGDRVRRQELEKKFQRRLRDKNKGYGW